MSAVSTPVLDPHEETTRALERLAAEQGLRLRSEAVSSRGRGRLGRVGVVLAAVLIGAVLIGAVAGWRLVIIRSGSMGERAPLGSLVVVSPRHSDAIEVDDIIVMTRDNKVAITHAVTAIERSGASVLATTKGAANPNADPVPYLLDDETLTVRMVIPNLGRVAALAHTHWLGLLLVLAAAFVISGRDEQDIAKHQQPKPLKPYPSVV